jgi:folylpolyglutamate synthase/dihydrofolate synthase
MLPYVEPKRGTPECPTFFELLTCLALDHFARSDVDVAVLEVGLGGRLDATTAVRPVASLITHVGLDHTAVLGETTTAIAAEKAAIAKRNVPLVSGVSATSAAGNRIVEVAGDAGARLYVAGREFRIRTGRPEYLDGRSVTPVRLRAPDDTVLELRPSVLGRELARDAALAAATLTVPSVAKKLRVSPDAIEQGMTAIRAPGRIQVVSESPLVVVDGAHNPDSALALVDTLREALRFRRVFAIVGGGIDKDVPGTARAVAGLTSRTQLLFTRPAGHPRAAAVEEIAPRFRNARIVGDLETALATAKAEAGEDDLIVVTGSLYLAGEALSLLG